MEQKYDDTVAQVFRVMNRLKKASIRSMPVMDVRPRIIMLLNTIQTVGGGEPVMVSKVSEKLGVTPAAVTHMINCIEKKGLITRSPSKEDRRVIFISLTPEGHQLLMLFRRRFSEKIKGLIAYLGEENSKELLRLITLMCNYFENGENKEPEK